VVGAEDYKVQIVPVGAGSPQVAVAQTGGATNILADEVLNGVASGDYDLQVRALAADPANSSDWSVPVTITWDPKLNTPNGVTFS
jgi:hypothetical protein